MDNNKKNLEQTSVACNPGAMPTLHTPSVCCSALRRTSVTSELQLQELRILKMIPFDRRVVQFLGSCSLEGNILLVMEFMEV